MKFQVQSSVVSGTIHVPTSKSHTLRAILFASLAQGNSCIQHYLPSPDTDAMIQACRALGAIIHVDDSRLQITGVNGKIHCPADVIDAGNSGQVLRFVAAIAALHAGYTVLTGDHSIRYHRPAQPLLDGLNQLGVLAISTKDDGHAPLIIKGPLHPGYVELDGQDSQPVSGLLMALAFAHGPSEIKVNHAGEKPWVNLTLSWFDRLGIKYQRRDFEHYHLQGNAHYLGFNYTVPGDFSSAAFPIAAALITQSELILDNIDPEDIQGDKALIPVLQSMGAEIAYHGKQVWIKPSKKLKGRVIDVNDFIDAVPILAVLACFAEGQTKILGAKMARFKESDRLWAMTVELKKMGAQLELLEDGLIIEASSLIGAKVSSHQDHRIAMALAIAGLGAQGITEIDEVDCVKKSFPGFAQAMQAIGAQIKEIA